METTPNRRSEASEQIDPGSSTTSETAERPAPATGVDATLVTARPSSLTRRLLRYSGDALLCFAALGAAGWSLAVLLS